MSSKNEKVAERLASIITRLNNGERLNVNELAKDYQADKRTIQRDFNRLAILDFAETGRYYRLSKGKQGYLRETEIKRFANFACIQEMLPDLDRKFFLEKLNESVVIKGVDYENIQARGKEFDAIERAVKKTLLVEFDYVKVKNKYKPNTSKHYTLQPYRLLNKKGVWYVVGVTNDGEQLKKAFCFTQMSNITITQQTFEANSEVADYIQATDSIYYIDLVNEIVLQVNAEVSGYFERRKLLSNQEIIKKFDDGGLLLSCKQVSPREIIPQVKSWIPNIRILSPQHLQEQMEGELRGYLDLTKW